MTEYKRGFGIVAFAGNPPKDFTYSEKLASKGNGRFFYLGESIGY
ncbi:MAG: hypothetical protein UY05_C0009G0018 [Candidatus Peregrinibacteria bacterium GW2011_GWA2_47_7]|nr:MAG: hypothetical protein UY05_C0009G0018 [Candidatus Peregrinibacteria bacterium GW2011_GWA2_47_7]